MLCLGEFLLLINLIFFFRFILVKADLVFTFIRIRYNFLFISRRIIGWWFLLNIRNVLISELISINWIILCLQAFWDATQNSKWKCQLDYEGSACDFLKQKWGLTLCILRENMTGLVLAQRSFAWEYLMLTLSTMGEGILAVFTLSLV